jgi:hypothetical protein
MELTGIRTLTAAATHRRLPGLLWTEMGNIRKPGVFPRNGLAAYAETLQNRLINFGIGIAQVRQEPATLGDQSQQPFSRTMVLFVRLEMLCQQRNPLAQQSDLYFRRPGIRLVTLIRGKNLPLGFNCQCHSRGSCSLSSLNLVFVPIQNTTARRPGRLQ